VFSLWNRFPPSFVRSSVQKAKPTPNRSGNVGRRTIFVPHRFSAWPVTPLSRFGTGNPTSPNGNSTPASRACLRESAQQLLEESAGRAIDQAEVGVYHCVQMPVRRAWLCGQDSLTGQNFDHRKVWIQERLEFLAGQFSIDVCSVATVLNFGRWFHRAVGRVDGLAAESARRGRRWLQGLSHSRIAFAQHPVHPNQRNRVAQRSMLR
jgi:hypothetical protein